MKHVFKFFTPIKRNKMYGWMMITMSAIIYTLGINIFLRISGTFPSGLGAIASLLTYVFKEIKSYFSLIYLCLNIPLMIVFWKKIKKRFMYRTIYFLLAQAAFGAIFIIPGVNDVFNGIIEQKYMDAGWPIIVLPVGGALMVGASVAIAWRYGGSTAGTDIVAYYFSTKRKMSVGLITFIMAFIIAMASFFIIIALDEQKRETWFLSFSGTMVFIILSSRVINVLYPKYSKRKIEIHSSKYNEIVSYLKENKFDHAYYTTNVTSGYTNQDRKIITTVVLLLEVKPLLRALRKIDPHIWVSEVKVERIWGNFQTKSVE